VPSLDAVWRAGDVACSARVWRLRLPAAFLVVYLVWGGTYAAIRVGVTAVPPAMLSGLRFVIAGMCMTGYALARGHRLPDTRREWLQLLLLGITMIVFSNGLVTWAEQYVPSNESALIVTSSALWTAWLGTFGPNGHPLSARSKLGLAVGFAGVALLFWPRGAPAAQSLGAQLVLLVSALSWASGSIYARNHPLPVSTVMLAGLQMTIGGVIMLAVSTAAREYAHVTWNGAGLASLAYLTVFGSCVAYATYFWLVRNTTPDRLSTVAYVNPAVATLLGWAMLDEALTGTQLAGMVVILTGVVLVVWQRRPRVEGPSPSESPSASGPRRT